MQPPRKQPSFTGDPNQLLPGPVPMSDPAPHPHLATALTELLQRSTSLEPGPVPAPQSCQASQLPGICAKGISVVQHSVRSKFA